MIKEFTLTRRHSFRKNDRRCICTPVIFIKTCRVTWYPGTKLNWGPYPHFTGGIWKRRFHSESTSNVFRPHHAEGIWKRKNQQSFRIGVWGKLGKGNHVIIVTSSSSKSSVFKMFSIHPKMQSKRFQIYPVWRAFSRKAPFSVRICVNGRPNRSCVFKFL